jgi:hypothetical protein
MSRMIRDWDTSEKIRGVPVQTRLGSGDYLFRLFQVAVCICVIRYLFGKIVHGIKVGNPRCITQGTRSEIGLQRNSELCCCRKVDNDASKYDMSQVLFCFFILHQRYSHAISCSPYQAHSHPNPRDLLENPIRCAIPCQSYQRSFSRNTQVVSHDAIGRNIACCTHVIPCKYSPRLTFDLFCAWPSAAASSLGIAIRMATCSTNGLSSR